MITVTCEKMILGGDCIVNTNGKTVLVSGALPNEVVEADITEEKTNFLRAKTIRVLQKSPYRVEPRCEYFGICGGCALQYVQDEHQIELRKNMLIETCLRAGIGDLKNTAGAKTLPDIEVIFDQSWEYRNRFQLHDGGLKAKKSDSVVNITDCPIANPHIRSFLKTQKAKNGRIHLFAYNNKIVNSADNNTVCDVELLGKKIRFDVRGFFQSNIHMLEKIIPYVCEDLHGESCADMYAGVGTFSAFLAEKFTQTVLIEHNKEALVFAQKNVQNKPLIYGVSGEKWVKCAEAQKKFDAVVIDPPRSGIEKTVLSWLIKNKPAKIRYVSCDPATMARDAAILTKNGFCLKKLVFADFYPQTSHIESIAWLECL